jgi:hypothetical protein
VYCVTFIECKEKTVGYLLRRKANRMIKKITYFVILIFSVYY